VRFGVVLPIGPGSVADAARRIEAAGFDSAWVVDAHNRGLLLQDPFAALAVAATHTTRLEVGSCVANGRWIRRAATEFDGWIGSARSTDVATLRQGLDRFRDAGGRRAVAANLAASRPDTADVLHELAEAGFDDAVVIVDRHDDDELARVRALVTP